MKIRLILAMMIICTACFTACASGFKMSDKDGQGGTGLGASEERDAQGNNTGEDMSIPGLLEQPAVETAIPSAAELERQMEEQPVYVLKTEILVQDSEHKSIYPDLLSAVIKNNSGGDVKNAVVAFAAWDENNFPVRIEGQYSFGKQPYICVVDCGDVNLLDGETFGENKGYSLNKDHKINKAKAIVVSYKDFDGNEWENPLYDAWKLLYEDKKLVEE